ncbi:hypothetical protein Dimus_023189 [Dionaea muscipula]
MSATEDVKEQQEQVDGDVPVESPESMSSSQDEEAAIKKKYGGIVPKKPSLISKDHERAYFDSADWALGKQGVEKPKGPLEALRPKLQVVSCLCRAALIHLLAFVIHLQNILVFMQLSCARPPN